MGEKKVVSRTSRGAAAVGQFPLGNNSHRGFFPSGHLSACLRAKDKLIPVSVN